MMSNYLFTLVFVCVAIYLIAGNIQLAELSKFSSSYFELKKNVSRYFNLYTMYKAKNDTENMTEALGKLKGCYTTYVRIREEKNKHLRATDRFRNIYPKIFSDIDNATEEMETIFTISGLMA